MIRAIITFSTLAAIWLLWSGYLETLLLFFGFISILLVMGITHRMDALVETPRVYRMGVRPVLYVPWLLWEMVKSNLAVARIILHPKLPIAPRLIQLSASQTTDLGQVIYANSITLTPGTITLELRDSQLLVHALTEEAAIDLQSGEMDRRVVWMEGHN